MNINTKSENISHHRPLLYGETYSLLQVIDKILLKLFNFIMPFHKMNRFGDNKNFFQIADL